MTGRALKEPAEIRRAYSRTDTAEDYIDERFTSAWGSVIHATQVRALNDVVRRYGVNRLLEIAPGPARLSRDVSGFQHGYLCEYNESMLKVAQRRLAGPDSRWTVIRGDAFHLPFHSPAQMDLVYTFRFIRHFALQDRVALYRQIHAALKDDGLFVFDAVNAKRRPGDAAAYPIFDELYDRESLKQELADNGFVQVSMTDVLRHPQLQYRIQVLVAPRLDALARVLIRSLELVPGEPLEWIVVCRKVEAGRPGGA